MANGSKGNDVVLESRHLIGLFVVIVVIFGVVFSLGYELGRNQVGTHVQAAAAPPDNDAASPEPALKPEVITNPASSATKSPADASKSASQPAAPAADWDFYKSADSNPPPAHLEKPAKTDRVNSAASQPVAIQPKTTINTARTRPTPVSVPVKSTKSPSMDAPLLPHGSILLQVAALTRQSDALSMASILHQKRFPAIVVPPGADHYYHVQVGPYRDVNAANHAREALEKAGFNSIIKR